MTSGFPVSIGQTASASILVCAIVLCGSTSLAGPIPPEAFAKIAKSRGDALGTQIFEDARFLVYSPDIGSKSDCRLSQVESEVSASGKGVNANLDEAQQTAHIERERKAIQPLLDEMTLLEKERRKWMSLEPTTHAQLLEKERILTDGSARRAAIRRELVERGFSSDGQPLPNFRRPQSGPTTRAVLPTVAVSVFRKDRRMTDAIVDVETGLAAMSANNGWPEALREFASQASTSFLPRIEKACADVRRVDVLLGFNDIVLTDPGQPASAVPAYAAAITLLENASTWNASIAARELPRSIATMISIADDGTRNNYYLLQKPEYFYADGRFLDVRLPPAAGIVTKPAHYWDKYQTDRWDPQGAIVLRSENETLRMNFGIPIRIFEGRCNCKPGYKVAHSAMAFYEAFSRKCSAHLGNGARSFQIVYTDTSYEPNQILPTVDVTRENVVTVKSSFAGSYEKAFKLRKRTQDELLSMVMGSMFSGGGMSGAAGIARFIEHTRVSMERFIETEKCTSPAVSQMAENYHRYLNGQVSLQAEAAGEGNPP